MATYYITGSAIIVIGDGEGCISSTSSYVNDWQEINSSEIDDEPEKEEPDEPVERCYPTRHEDEILRIIMRQEVWKPPKQMMKAECRVHSAFFLFKQNFA